ncbi:MAG: trigger factor [Thermovibrio sp.]|nr:MAG: trigger factor [Thermovibrio sp.]
MKYELENVSDVIKKVKMELEPEEVEKEVKAICREIGRRAKVPGFRPGKAPASVIRKYYEEDIKDTLLRTLVPQKLAEVLEKEGLNLISDPGVESYNADLKENRVNVVLILEVKPEIEINPEDYKGIKVKRTKRNVGDEDVQKVIEGLRNQSATWKEVDREAKEGDLVELEYETQVEGEEESHKGEVSVVLGQEQLWPEVEKEVLGKKAGEEGEVEFEAPDDEKYGEARGKKVKVKFKVKSVKEKELPEVNDEFARKFGFESLEDMRKKILEDLETAEKIREQEEVEDQIVEELLKKVNVPVPPSMLDLEIRAQAQNQLNRLAQIGVDVRQMSPEGIVEMVKPTAEKTVKVKLLLERIAELEGIEVTDEDVESEIQKLADSTFGGDYVKARQSLEEKGLLNMIKQDILRQKALDRLIELAEVEEVEAKEEENKEEKEG